MNKLNNGDNMIYFTYVVVCLIILISFVLISFISLKSFLGIVTLGGYPDNYFAESLEH